MRAALALPAMRALDEALLLHALRVYEETTLHFVDAYLVATVQLIEVRSILSFDRGLDAIASVTRLAQ